MRRVQSTFFLTIMLLGCGHTASHGTIAMMASDNMAHVSIHGVKIGDKVQMYRNDCKRITGGKMGRSCKREQIAIGEVTRVFDDHYAEVRFPAGTTFVEGDFVEISR